MADTLEFNQAPSAETAAFSMRETSAAELAGSIEQDRQDRMRSQAEQPTVGQVQQEVYEALGQPEIGVHSVRHAYGLGYNITHGFRKNAIDLSENRG